MHQKKINEYYFIPKWNSWFSIIIFIN
jgi:hypothetical protein